jgi:hypothetical protein
MRSVLITTVLAATLAASCADPAAPTDPPAGIDHPTDPSQVVLRLSYEGGFVPIEWTLTSFPRFTLYGDGTVITGGAQVAIYPGPALPPLIRRSLDEEGIQAILRAARDAGLGERDIETSETGQLLIADAATSVFTHTADGRTTTASVYALAELADRPEGMSDEEFRLRRSLARFAERLTDLDSWLPAGSLGPEEPFRADAARVYVGRYRSQPDLEQAPIAWPLGDLRTFGEPSPTFPELRCGAVTGEGWATLREAAAQANQLTPWVSGDLQRQVLFRPLLPDESGC